MNILRSGFILGLEALIFLSACQSATPKEAADLVIKNGTIFTVDKSRTIAQSMAIKGDVIIYVGDNQGVQKARGG